MSDIALSIQQPWAWLIVNGYKDVENRNWLTHVRGRIFVHAGKKFDSEGYAWVQERFPHIRMPMQSEFDFGGIVGSVELANCVHAERFKPSAWAFGEWCFYLINPTPLPFQPCRGKLGFFRPEVPPPSPGA